MASKEISGLRILHVIDYCYPVLGYQEIFLAKEHSRLNDTKIVTSNRYSKRIYDANKKLLGNSVGRTGLFAEEGLKVLRLPTKFNFDFLDSPWLMGLEKEILNLKPDVIFAHGLINLTSIRIALLKLKMPNTVIIFDDHMTYNATRGGWTNLLYKMFKLTFSPLFKKSTNTFVAVTIETKKFMQYFYGIPEEEITVIPLGIDISHFYHDPKIRSSLRKELGIKDNEIVFIYAGKIIAQKGVHLFVDSALQVCKIHNNGKFLIVGGDDPSYLASLKNKINAAGMESKFSFMPAVPNQVLYKYYSAADVGVWPLQCSMTMLEATACGLPIIISNKSGANERATNGNGVLYLESDREDLTKKFILLLDPKIRRAMSEKANEYAKTISWKSIADKFLTLAELNAKYKETLKTKKTERN